MELPKPYCMNCRVVFLNIQQANRHAEVSHAPDPTTVVPPAVPPADFFGPTKAGGKKEVLL